MRNDRSSPILVMWCTVPRGTHTTSPLTASIRAPPVNSQRRRPARIIHHSSKSLCQCGRLPPPGPAAISVTRFRSSWINRTDQGGGPIRATTSSIRVWNTFGKLALTTRGGIGPLTTSVIFNWHAGSAGAVMAHHDTARNAARRSRIGSLSDSVVAFLALVAQRAAQGVEAREHGVQARFGFGQPDVRVALNSGEVIRQRLDRIGDVAGDVVRILDALDVLHGKR